MWFVVSTVIAYHIGILDQNPMLGTFPCVALDTLYSLLTAAHYSKGHLKQKARKPHSHT